MKLIDLNPDGGIGANSMYLRLGDFHLLIDAGLNPKKSGRQAAPDFRPLQGVQLDLVLLTHCHLDHLGAMPLALRDQPHPPVVMALPSHKLAPRMLHNSASVMEREREEHGTPDYPLYTHEEVDRVAKRFYGHPFGQPRKFTGAHDEIEFTLHSGGHIPGAAGIEIVHKRRRIFITGDVLFAAQRTLPGANFPHHHIDVLITETTRGLNGRALGRGRAEEAIRLVDTINATLRRGGSVLIPVFALGRMQELLAVLHDARKFNRLDDAPIFASGLGLEICHLFDDISRKTNLIHFTRQILKDLKVKTVPRDLVPGKEPPGQGIYVISSGMMVENTPSYALAPGLVRDEKHSICFVGYCDPDTPGGQLLATRPGEEFLFEAVDIRTRIRAPVTRFDLSGHADREELLEYAAMITPHTVVVTHGDASSREWFKERLPSRLPHHSKVLDPAPLQVYPV
ncbi:MAG: MBL fold metallo-hydrolase [Opitutaceae bacterium]|nr:MBL fold metallo-hydrolase [Opitutaceae bacterium]